MLELTVGWNLVIPTSGEISPQGESRSGAEGSCVPKQRAKRPAPKRMRPRLERPAAQRSRRRQRFPSESPGCERKASALHPEPLSHLLWLLPNSRVFLGLQSRGGGFGVASPKSPQEASWHKLQLKIAQDNTGGGEERDVRKARQGHAGSAKWGRRGRDRAPCPREGPGCAGKCRGLPGGGARC